MPSLADLMRKKQEKLDKTLKKPIKIKKPEKTEILIKDIPEEIIVPKTEVLNRFRKIEKDSNGYDKRYNQSVELNLIKSIYANRFGSSSDKIKPEMQNAMINVWKKELILLK